MKIRVRPRAALLALALAVTLAPHASARTIRGTVTSVPAPDSLHIEHEFGQNDIRIWGIEVPADPAIAGKAAAMVSELAMGKLIRVRHKFVDNGVIVGRVLIGDDEPVTDVAVALLEAGLAKRSSVESGRLDEAQAKAKSARAGIWAGTK